MNTGDLRTLAGLICANDSPSVGRGDAAKAINDAAAEIDRLNERMTISGIARLIDIEEAASDLHGYLHANCPDIVSIKSGSELAAEGVRHRLAALGGALKRC